MSVEKIIISIIVSLFQGTAATIIICRQIQIKALKEKIKLLIPMCIYCSICFLFIPNQIRFILFIIITSLIIYFFLKIKDKKLILYSFNLEMIMSISEIIVTLFLVLFGINSVDIVNNNLYNLLANILISLLSICLIYIPFFIKIIYKINNMFDKNSKLINYLYIFIFVVYLIVSKNGLELILKSNYYVNILFIIGIVAILTVIIKNESKYDKLNEQNKQMLNYVTKYEKIITDQGKANHEFRNQLMVIRGYAQMKSPKLIEYLDSIVDDTKKTHSSYLISQLNNFPDGGIKGLLYYKLSMMDDENIKYEINVEYGVKTKLKTLDTIMYKNITKILGVLLDNAIDASKESKNKKITISSIKESSKVIFSISNTYKGKIDMSKLGSGHSTKGNGHGYGLRLVNDIVNENECLNVENKLDNDYFITNLIIQIKKKKQ